MQHRVDWSAVVPTSIPWFLERFTLHDSGLRSIAMDWDGRTILEIEFDLHWNPSIPQGLTTLWIRFDHPYRVTYTQGGWSQATLAGAESAALDRQQRDAIRVSGSFDRNSYQHSGTDHGFTYPPDDETLTRTVFELINWGKLEFVHAAPVRIAVAETGTRAVDVTTLTVARRWPSQLSDEGTPQRGDPDTVSERICTPRPNPIEAADGFSVDVLGRGMRYAKKGRRLFIDSEVLAPTGSIALYRNSIRAWDPPHENEVLDEKEREEIIDNVTAALTANGYTLLIV